MAIDFHVPDGVNDTVFIAWMRILYYLEPRA